MRESWVCRGDVMGTFSITDEKIDGHALLEEVRCASAGAVVTFEGRVREENDDRSVESLSYEIYPELARTTAEEMMDEVKSEEDVERVAIATRTGSLQVGEASIWIAVSAAHRKEAFRTCEWLIDEIKQRLPVWKKEVYENGEETWINQPETGREPS